MFTCVLGHYVASTILLVPKPSMGADRSGGQLCLVSGVTSSGRVWMKVPESDARSVGHAPWYSDGPRNARAADIRPSSD